MLLIKVHYFPVHQGHVLNESVLDRLGWALYEGFDDEEVMVIFTEASRFDQGNRQINITIEVISNEGDFDEEIYAENDSETLSCILGDELRGVIPLDVSSGLQIVFPTDAGGTWTGEAREPRPHHEPAMLDDGSLLRFCRLRCLLDE